MKHNLISILLDPNIKSIIDTYSNLNHHEFALKFSGRNDLPIKEIAEQIDCRIRANKKLPSLVNHDLIFKKRAIEQCSSELTAEFKSQKISGKRIIDITGGLGVDCIFFSKQFEEVHYCEIDEELCEIADYNFKKLGIKNITVHSGSGIDEINSFPDNYFDWCFADPSRRKDERRSVDINFLQPDVAANLDTLQSKSRNQFFKLAPAFDINEAVRIFPGINEFLIVSVDNEIKETLVIINKNLNSRNKSAVILKNTKKREIISSDLYANIQKNFKEIKNGMYFYDADRAIKKINLTALIAHQSNLNFINNLSDYLTADILIENFPGRKFKILHHGKFNEKKLKQYLKLEGIKSANAARSNFPFKPEAILNKLKLRQGGNEFFFFTKDLNDELIFIRVEKLN